MDLTFHNQNPQQNRISPGRFTFQNPQTSPPASPPQIPTPVDPLPLQNILQPNNNILNNTNNQNPKKNSITILNSLPQNLQRHSETLFQNTSLLKKQKQQNFQQLKLNNENKYRSNLQNQPVPAKPQIQLGSYKPIIPTIGVQSIKNGNLKDQPKKPQIFQKQHYFSTQRSSTPQNHNNSQQQSQQQKGKNPNFNIQNLFTVRKKEEKSTENTPARISLMNTTIQSKDFQNLQINNRKSQSAKNSVQNSRINISELLNQTISQNLPTPHNQQQQLQQQQITHKKQQSINSLNTSQKPNISTMVSQNQNLQEEIITKHKRSQSLALPQQPNSQKFNEILQQQDQKSPHHASIKLVSNMQLPSSDTKQKQNSPNLSYDLNPKKQLQAFEAAKNTIHNHPNATHNNNYNQQFTVQNFNVINSNNQNNQTPLQRNGSQFTVKSYEYRNQRSQSLNISPNIINNAKQILQAQNNISSNSPQDTIIQFPSIPNNNFNNNSNTNILQDIPQLQIKQQEKQIEQEQEQEKEQEQEAPQTQRFQQPCPQELEIPEPQENCLFLNSNYKNSYNKNNINVNSNSYLHYQSHSPIYQETTDTKVDNSCIPVNNENHTQQVLDKQFSYKYITPTPKKPYQSYSNNHYQQQQNFQPTDFIVDDCYQEKKPAICKKHSIYQYQQKKQLIENNVGYTRKDQGILDKLFGFCTSNH